jgi:4-hydroxy-tetrahydrodipicolinate synthase
MRRQALRDRPLRGVIAAAATPITADLEPDLPRFLSLCRRLLDEGCDGLNVCGTTGEATSFSTRQRMAVMSAAAGSLPRDRIMAGTGAAALADAVALTRQSADLGLAGALVLPPFYYKGVDDEGLARCIECIVKATADRPIELYLYNFPALSGLAWSPRLVARLHESFGRRIAGLKDSSGDLAYAAEIAAISPELSVFPSNEAVLVRARAGAFAGCISASANVNARQCARAFRDGDAAALETATRIRALVSRKSLIASLKAVLAHLMGDAALRAVMPPLRRLGEADERDLIRQAVPLLAR